MENPLPAPRLISSIAVFGIATLGLVGPAPAQVFDPGPSDPALFDRVINLPGDRAPRRGISGSTQLNVGAGGRLDSLGPFNVNAGGEVNVGAAAEFVSELNANAGSEVNIFGGLVDGLTALSGSQVSIDGGSVRGFNAPELTNSELNILGGTVELGGILSSIRGLTGSTVDIRGGTLLGNPLRVLGPLVLGGGRVSASRGSSINVSGGFLGEASRPIGLSAELGGEVNFRGGDLVGGIGTGPGGVANISGGTLIGTPLNSIESDGVIGSFGGVVNISGGIIDGTIDVAIGNTTVNLFGTEFLLNGEPFPGLEPGVTVSIDGSDLLSGRLADGVLTGHFVDGSAFGFTFGFGAPRENRLRIGGDSTLTLTLVPEPTAWAMTLLLIGVPALIRRRC